MIAVTGGGTGGHTFPNISVIEELRKRGLQDIIWIGKKGGKEKFWAEKIHVPYYGIKTGKLRRYFSIKNFFDIFAIIIGFFQSLLLLLKLKPDLIFSKGGFVSVPPVLAAYILRIQIITHESDINPGLATRVISRFASSVCVSFEKTRGYFSKNKVFHTGNPIRGVIKQGNSERGMKFLNFKEDLPLVFVIGGSLGASSINEAVWEMGGKYDLSFNLVHQCGRGNFRKGYSQSKRYRQYEFFIDEMGDLLAASTIVISRAGAGAVYEIGYMKRPSILIPLPRTKSRGEQIENARYFEKNGASVIILDENLDGEILFKTVTRLLKDNAVLSMMGQKAGSLCKTDAEGSIVDIVESFMKK